MSAEQTSKLHRAFREIGFWTGFSRILGFARDLAFAQFLGAGPAADAFLVAFKLPNLFRRLTAEGAMTNAFLPVFSQIRAQKGREAALMLAAEVQIWLLLVLSLIVVLAEFFMPLVIGLLAPGFQHTPARFEAAVQLARITMPYLPMISLVALWAAITNAHDRFFGGAVAPVILNVMLITGALAIPLVQTADLPANWQGPQMLALPVALSVLAAGVGQMLLMQAKLAPISARPRWCLPMVSQAGRQMWRNFLPAALGAGGLQLNLLVDMILASFLPVGAVSWLYYSDRVAQLPLGIIGIALGTALLPRLSKLEAENQQAAVPAELANGLRLAGFFGLPAACAIFILAEDIIGGLFGRGAFRAEDVAAASVALMAYGVGIPAFVATKILQPAFYASGQPGTVLKISLSSVAFNVLASIGLMQLLRPYGLGHMGLALATSGAAWLVLGLQTILLLRQKRVDNTAFSALIKPCLASLVMGLFLIGLQMGLGPYLLPVLGGFLWLCVISLIGLICYFICAFYLGILPASLFRPSKS